MCDDDLIKIEKDGVIIIIINTNKSRTAEENVDIAMDMLYMRMSE